jgi:CheY-like chemotaxis protein
VSFRLVTHNFNEKFVEFIFIDITKEKPLASSKTESRIVNPVYTYDTKLAKELPNSIECIFELSRFILVESRAENSEENIPKILESAEYINKLCKASKELMLDYDLIKNTKFSCLPKCSLAHLKSCPICGVFKFCESCTVCKNCDQKKETTFDLPELTENIIDLFRTISKHENDYDSPFFSDQYENEEDFESKLITTNKQVLASIFFNIFFFSLRNTKKKSEVKLKIKRGFTKNNYVSTCIEITDFSQIEKGYLKLLKENEESNKNVTTLTISNENFKKYFEINLANSLVKKIGSRLDISSNEEGSIYTFTLSEPYTPREEYIFPKRKIRSEINQKNKFVEVSDDDTIVVELPNFNKDPIFFKKENPKQQILKEDKMPGSPKFGLEYETLAKPQKKTEYGKKRILIVASDTQSKDLLVETLKNFDDGEEIEIIKSETGYEALNIINEDFCQGKKFEIIITEEEMPKLKLANFTKLIREIYSQEENKFPFVICLSSSVAKQKELISNCGIDAVLKKDQISDLKKLYEDLTELN